MVNRSTLMEESKFLAVVCPRCKCKKVVFGKSCLRVKCDKCNYLLTQPQGGKAKIRARIQDILC